MQAAAQDLTNKIKANQSRYVDKAVYYNGGKYSSCSAKTISQVRQWYVDKVLHQVNEQYCGASDNINGSPLFSMGNIISTTQKKQFIRGPN